ncbi:hypothetical protein [Pseudonocardia sp.]|uniref:hypothetical protein n=1 Tax=Pseudonocardia sp. TaxID=60912 RepID=UPI003D0E1B26
MEAVDSAAVDHHSSSSLVVRVSGHGRRPGAVVEVAGRWRDGVVLTGLWGGRVGAVEVGTGEVGAGEEGAVDVVPGVGVAEDVPAGAVAAGAATGPIGGPGG